MEKRCICQRCSFSLPLVELQQRECSSVHMDLARLLCVSPEWDHPTEIVQHLLIHLETNWTLDRVDSILHSGDSRAALEHGYRSRRSDYDENSEALEVMLTRFDKGLEHWKKWVQEYKQDPITRPMTLVGFLRWCWHCCSGQFHEMYNFLSQAPAYTKAGTRDGKHGWPWAKNLHLLMTVVSETAKLFPRKRSKANK